MLAESGQRPRARIHQATAEPAAAAARPAARHTAMTAGPAGSPAQTTVPRRRIHSSCRPSSPCSSRSQRRAPGSLPLPAGRTALAGHHWDIASFPRPFPVGTSQLTSASHPPAADCAQACRRPGTWPRKTRPSFFTRIATSSRRNASSGLVISRLRSTRTGFGGSTTRRVGGCIATGHSSNTCVIVAFVGPRCRFTSSRRLPAAESGSLDEVIDELGNSSSGRANPMVIEQPAVSGDLVDLVGLGAGSLRNCRELAGRIHRS